MRRSSSDTSAQTGQQHLQSPFHVGETGNELPELLVDDGNISGRAEGTQFVCAVTGELACTKVESDNRIYNWHVVCKKTGPQGEGNRIASSSHTRKELRSMESRQWSYTVSFMCVATWTMGFPTYN